MTHVIARLIIALLLAAIVTFAVFWIMQTLVLSSGSVVEEQFSTQIIDFVDVSQDDEVVTKQRQAKKPPQQKKPPPKPDLPKPDVQDNVSEKIAIGDLTMDTDFDVSSGLSGAISDGEYLPLVKVAPQYPRRAAQRGIEGYVIISFTVDATGRVVDPIVIEAQPKNIFNRAALAAVKKFKYKPKVIDGKPIEVQNVKNIIRFQLEK